MRNSRTFHPFLRIFFYAFLMDIAIFLAVGLVFLLAGWQTFHQYGNGLVWTGAIGAILLLVGSGWRNGRREELVGLSGVMREHEVFYQLNRDNDSRARFMFGALIALALAFAIGLVLLRIP